MTNDIVIGDKTYKLTAPDGTGVSRRLDASTGLNTPVNLTIRQATVKDAGKASHLSTVRMSLLVPINLGAGMQEMSVSMSVKVPKDASVEYSTVSDLVDRLRGLVNTDAIRTEIIQSRLS